MSTKKSTDKKSKEGWEKLEKKTIVVSPEAWDKIMEMLENPPEPNEAFKKAAKEFKEKYGKK